MTDTDPQAPLPADFDLAAWIAGVQSTVRSCTLYARADLLAVIEDLERRIRIEEKAAEDEDSLDGGDVEDLTEQLESAYADFVGSGVTFKVQGRSADWLRDTEKRVSKSAEANGLSKDDKAELVTLHQLADAIVEPSGVTVEMLRHLREVNDPQYRKLVSTFFQACSQAPAVSVPTSPSSSASRGGRRR